MLFNLILKQEDLEVRSKYVCVFVFLRTSGGLFHLHMIMCDSSSHRFSTLFCMEIIFNGIGF